MYGKDQGKDVANPDGRGFCFNKKVDEQPWIFYFGVCTEEEVIALDKVNLTTQPSLV